MDNTQFNEILEARISKIKNVLGSKAGEYAFNNDRLYNFKVASRINKETPEQALWGMATKHLVSVIDLVDGRLEQSIDNIDEKIGDFINYLILLEAVLLEKRYDSLIDK